MSSPRNPRSHVTGFSLVGLCALLLAGLVGCEKEAVTSYKAPRLHRRLLAAVIPHGDTTWFLKLVGPSEAVTRHAEEFDRFVRSVRFPNKEETPIEWELPEGWVVSESTSEFRYATFQVGRDRLELTIVKLPGEAGSLVSNVNRWRGQLGLPPIDEAELAPLTRREVTKAGPVTFVDLTTAEAAPAERPPPKPTRKAGDLKYEVPEGWKETGAGGIRKAGFEVRDGDDKAETTITTASGDVVPNVQRWRTQVGLEPGTEDEVKKELQSIEALGAKRPYADLAGPGGKRILAVIIEQPGQTLFVKMMGPTALVGKQKSAFETLVRSLRMAGE